MDELSFVVVADFVLWYDDILGGSEKRCQLGHGGALVPVAISDIDVEAVLVEKLFSLDGRGERGHCDELRRWVVAFRAPEDITVRLEVGRWGVGGGVKSIRVPGGYGPRHLTS